MKKIKDIEDDVKIEKDIVEECSGDKWTFQLSILILMYFSQFPVAFHQMNIIFMAPPVSYVCADNNTEVRYNRCPCEHPEYDRELFQETIITTWDLICSRQWFVSVSQTCFELGILVGSVIFGSLSDKFGRKKPLIIGNAILLVAGVATAFATDLWIFALLRFVIGAMLGSCLVISFVLQMELSTSTKRDVIAVLFQLAFNIGYLLMPGFGYFIRNWRYLQLALSLPAVAVMSYIWLMPESPRWCLAVGRTGEAVNIIKRIAKFNNMPIDNIEDIVTKYQERSQKLSSYEQKPGTILDLFRTKNIRRRVICMALVWSVCAFGYFGVNTYVGQLNGNIFLNTSFLAAITWPGLLLYYFLTKYTKRRTAEMILFTVASICMFVISFLQNDNDLKVALACIAAVCLYVSFILAYLYAAEMFPTVVRNAALGLTSMFARVGSMIASFVAYMSIYGTWVPPFIFGLVPMLAGVICYFMVETKGCVLMTTIEEGENFQGESKKNKITVDLNKF